MALGRMERILILAKTCPSPSAQYVDTINCGNVIDTQKSWGSRWEWLEK